MKEYAIVLGVVAVTIVAALWAEGMRIPKTPAGQVCSTEAKLCPDGSYIARTGPNCEFAPCPAATTTSPGTSGVRGTISLGPTCPVERIPPDPACADKPYATAIAVYRAGSSSPFIIGNSNTTGAFSLTLPPGSYTLNAGNGTMLPRCTPVNVIVVSAAYATTSISCDTGIR
ncbi:MAG TPA: hypothetical protein VNF51_00370 [Candidatus Paceibacterota bacterium]|nr:hypothetical protein [Candidatus Paceibacterota bacterium]